MHDAVPGERHGEDAHSLTSVSQNVPVYPAWHTHENPFTASAHETVPSATPPPDAQQTQAQSHSMPSAEGSRS